MHTFPLHNDQANSPAGALPTGIVASVAYMLSGITGIGQPDVRRGNLLIALIFDLLILAGLLLIIVP